MPDEKRMRREGKARGSGGGTAQLHPQLSRRSSETHGRDADGTLSNPHARGRPAPSLCRLARPLHRSLFPLRLASRPRPHLCYRSGCPGRAPGQAAPFDRKDGPHEAEHGHRSSAFPHLAPGTFWPARTTLTGAVYCPQMTSIPIFGALPAAGLLKARCADPSSAPQRTTSARQKGECSHPTRRQSSSDST